MLAFSKRTTLVVILSLVPFCLSLFLLGQSDGLSQEDGTRPVQLVCQREYPVISSALASFLSQRPSEDSLNVWVFFTDKGIFSQVQYQRARGNFQSTIESSALRRRLKNRVVVDFVDLPVSQDYVDAIVELGGKLRHRSRWLNAVSVQIQAGSVDHLARLPFVRKIRKVASFKRRPPEVVPFGDQLYRQMGFAGYGRNYGPSLEQLDQIGVPTVHDMGFKGQNVIVCMLDTGYRKDHQAFDSAYAEGRVLAEWDFINDDDNTQNEAGDPSDQHNHGTSTWSALGGEYDGELYGPAFEASFVLAKTENVAHELPIEEDHWVAGLEWADSIGAEVASSSLGYTTWDDTAGPGYTYEDLDGNTAVCTQAADLAASRGLLVANAAGNERLKDWHYIVTPGDGDSVLTVGAVDWQGVIASFSSVGPTYDGRTKPDVVARGVNTYCALASGIDQYGGVGGTSLSTPLVGGCAAVLLSAHPDWTVIQVRETLMMTADNAFTPDTVYGWGLVNLLDALNYDPFGAMGISHNPPLFSADTLNPYVMDVTIIPGANGLNQDSLYLFWRSDTLSPFVREDLQSVGSNQYQAQIPAQSEGTIVHYYFSARDGLGYMVNLPLGAPDFKFKLFVNTEAIAFDFEDGLFLWETGGVGNHWNITSVDSHTRTFSLTDSPPAVYEDNSDSWAQIKHAFDLSDATGPQLSFWHRYHFWTGDSGFVEINTGGGKGWEGLSAFADSQYTWTQVNLLLDPYVGYTDVQFRFRLQSDGSGTSDGWYIDDVQVNFKPTSVEEEAASVPPQFSLHQNYPNPFNPTTLIRFSVHSSRFAGRPAHASLKIYNLRGQVVRTLVDEEMQPGEHSVMWDGKDEQGREVASGVYFYQLAAQEIKVTKKMLLLK